MTGNYVSAWLAARAYTAPTVSRLTHVVEFMGDEPYRVLCSRAALDSILRDAATYGAPGQATCPTCARKWAKLVRLQSAQDRAYQGLDPKFNAALARAWGQK